jgi:hypothetical protein
MNEPEDENETGEERLFSWRRLKIMILGSILAVVIGLVLASLYTYTQYGGTPFDSLLGRNAAESPDLGKLAYTKGTDFFIGVVKGEGINSRRVPVYYIEQAGGQMIEVSKERVEVRPPKGSG